MHTKIPITIWWIASHVRKDLHDLERKVRRYNKEPLDQEAYNAELNGIYSDVVTVVMEEYILNTILGYHPSTIVAKRRAI